MPFRAMGKKTWRPAAFTQADMVLISWILAMIPVLTAADSLVPWLPSHKLEIIAWMALFTFGGLFMMVGMIQRRHGMIWIGHMILAVLNAILAVSSTVQFWFTGDGLRPAAQSVLVTVLHLMFMLRMGPRPLSPESAKVVIASTVTADAGTDGRDQERGNDH